MRIEEVAVREAIENDVHVVGVSSLAAIFGPGSPVAKSACQILEILLEEE